MKKSPLLSIICHCLQHIVNLSWRFIRVSRFFILCLFIFSLVLFSLHFVVKCLSVCVCVCCSSCNTRVCYFSDNLSFPFHEVHIQFEESLFAVSCALSNFETLYVYLCVCVWNLFMYVCVWRKERWWVGDSMYECSYDLRCTRRKIFPSNLKWHRKING